MGKITVNTIIGELNTIAHTLEEFNLCYDIKQDQTLANFSFENTIGITDLLEQKIDVITHELASEIRLQVNQIELILKFANFRQKYSHWSNKELENIIDGQTAIHVLKNYLDMHFINNTVERQKVSQEIKALRVEWNKLFSNKNYKQIMSDISVKE